MPTRDDQLVKQITEQVLAALQREKSAGPSASSAAPINPPIGVCTGDYSQFTDRPDLVNDTDSPITPTSLLGGIVTAAQLQEAIDGSTDRVANLAPDARLTPLAADFVREHPEKVRRGTHVEPRDPKSEIAGVPWLWWADGHCPAVQSIVATHRPQVRPSAAPRSESGLLQVVRDLKTGLHNQTLSGGLLFVSSAVRASLFANRCAEIRAVVANCEEVVNEAIGSLSANALIIEYPYVDERKMSAMVSAMLAKPPKASPHLARELAELQRSPQR